MPIRLERAEEIARFYEHHAERLRRAITAKTSGLDAGIVDDACSYAWEKLLQRPDIDLDHKNAYWWVHKVALRQAWDFGRRQQRERSSGGMNGADEDRPEPISQGEDILDVVAEHVDHTTIRRLLGELHWRERRELLLYAHGLSYEEIAQVTGTSYTAVNRWLARGKKKLRDARDHGRITPDDPRWQPNRRANRR
jgi:RNA polymerase sigma factor (sigma-70 family)